MILVAGAFSYRKFKGLVQLSRLLSSTFTVINYDRRGRGDSGDTLHYSVDREIDDLEALARYTGGNPFVWGLSSGATLALRAAARGVAMRKLAVYEPPFLIDHSAHVPPLDFAARLKELALQDRRSDAVRFFMVDGMGAPRIAPLVLRLFPRAWGRLKAVAHTLPYDAEILGATIQGIPPKPEEWAAVTVQTLVMYGEKTAAGLQSGANAIARVLQHAEVRVLKGQTHNVSMHALAPVLKEYFS